MKFSEYKRLREEEEQDTGIKIGVSSATEERKTTGTRFTDIMKEREPERYSNMMAERSAKKASNVLEFTNKVNQYAAYTNMQTADSASYINRNEDTYTADAAENASRRSKTYDNARQQAFDLMKEAWRNENLDTELRQQSLNILLNSVGNMQRADKANNAFADYMGQFANEDAFTRTKEAERKQEEIKTLSEEELHQRIQEAEKNLETVKKQDKVSTKTMGFRALQEHMKTQTANEMNIENEIQSYENEIFARQQQEALDGLTDETKEAFERLYSFSVNGPEDKAKQLLQYTPLYDGYAREKDRKELTKAAVNALETQGIPAEQFESLYEYYKFRRDEERAGENAKETQAKYEDSGALGKIGMNTVTVLNTPFRGVSAAAEGLASLQYENEYAPLNTNSLAYDMTNYTDTVRNATSQDIDNNTLNFLYQTGMSMADMGALLPLSAVTGGAASLAIMGTNAGTSAAKEATLRGVSKEHALMTGIAAGTAEVVFEKVSLDQFWDIARKQGKAATRNAFLNIVTQAGIEGSEEVFTDLANTFTDNLINHGLSEWYQNMDSYYKQGMSMTEAQKAATVDYCKQLGYSFLGGALSGGVFGAGAVVNTSLTGKKNTMTADDYTQVAEGIDTDRASYASQEDYDKAMAAQHLAQTLSEKEKVTDFEKGLFNQAAVELSNISYNEQNNPKEQIRQIASAMENETISRAFIADYKEGMPVETYTRAFNNFYSSGYTEIPFEKALEANKYFASVIEEPTLYGIYCLGQNQATVASEQYASQEQKELVSTMANALGVKVEYQDISGANGMYKDGVIYISNKTINPSMVVMSHELTHELKETANEEYMTYENYVIDYFKEFHAKDYETLYSSMTEHYGNDEALIREEIAANAAETFLTDAEAVNRFVKENRSIAERIADFLNNFITKLKEVYQGYTAKGKAGKMLAEDIEVYEKARDLWYEAVKASEGKNNTFENNINESLQNHEKKLSLKEYDSWDKKDPRVKFHVANVSEPLVSVGIDENREITFDSKKIIKIKADHPEMTDEVIKNVDKIIQEPIAIMNSASVAGRITLVGELEGENGVPVLLALELHPSNSKGIEVEEIKICSAYTKDKFLNWFKNQDFLWINPNKNKTNKWLKRTRVQFPVGINQYGLIKSIPQKQQNSNAKFSLKEPMEETKNLIALHNLTSDKFMKTLDLGGFPMPSIAITTTDIGHSNFGDISCVFYKDTIDPANKKNKVFGADAWTPTFPRVEYEADLNVARNVYDTVSEYAKKLPGQYQNTVRGFVSGLEHSINNWGGYEGIIEEALRNTSMKAAYLVSKGEKVEEIKKTQVSELESQKKKSCEMLLQAYGSKADKFDGKESGKILYEALGEETKEVLIQNAVSEGDTEENARAFANKLNKIQIASSIRNALKYRENKGIETTTVIDFESMRKDIENRVDMNGYEGWIRDLFEGIEKNSGLWNGKDLYTSSGNMRSFKQTHIPFNVQNIVEAMLKQSDDVRNVAGYNGTKTIRAVVTEDFKSISEIKHAAKTKLKNIDTDKYNALRNKLDERLNKVICDIVDAKPISDNILIDMDNVGEIIIEACKNPTADNFKNTFNKHSRICTNEQAKEIADIVDTVANMPVNMFEAKPLRVVDFSEVAAVILPKGTSKELIQKITDNGMRIMEYEAGNESERKEVLNSIQGVKFSLKSYADDIGLRFSDKEGADLFEAILMGTDNIDYESVLVNDGSESYRATMDLIRESARILHDGVAAAGKLKNLNVTRDMAQAMAAHYLNKYSATFDVDTLTDNLYNIFAYIQKTKDVNYQDMIRVMQEVCKPVIATSQKIDKEVMKQYNDFRKTVRSYRLKLNQEQKAEIASVYDSFNKFKNVNQNKYTFREDGSYLDSVWSELVEASGYALSFDVSPSEQMLVLHDYMTTLEKSIVSPAEDMNNSQVAYDMALNIYTDYFKLIGKDKQAIQHLSTQMKKKLNEYKQDVRNDYKDKFKKYKEEAEIKKQDEINRLQKQIRELERERDDALYEADDITVNLLDGNINALEYKIGKISKRNVEKLSKLTAQSYNRSVQRAITRQQTEIKNHIKKNMFDLQNRLAKPKENKFIPQGLVRATIDLCEAVNINTGRSEKLAERLNEMSHLYARLKEDKDYAIASEYDEHTQEAIDRLREVFSGRNITMLNMMELKEVDSLITQLRFQIINAGKLINMEKAKEVYETAVRCMDEINAAKSYDLDKSVSRGLNHYTTAMLSPKRQFRRMSGYKKDSVLNQIYDDLNNGQQKQMQVLMETARIFDPVTKGEHNQKAISKLVGKEKKDWIDIGLTYKNLDPVIVPRAFRVSLAMHIQNKANLDHIIYGGLTIPEPKAYQRGDYTTAYATGMTIYFMPSNLKSVEDRQIAYNQAVKKLKSVVAEMTPYERSMVKCSEKFFHEYTGEKINETSLQLNGYKKARVHNYFPIRTDSNFNHSEIEGLVRNGTLEHMPMLNNRVGARNPILLEDITQVIKRQSENVAKYYGLAIPVRNFNKIYNTTKIGYTDSTKSTIARKWGVTGLKYIENLLTDLQSKRGQGSSILDTLQGNFAQAVLSDNISIALQQVVAYPTAAATLGHDAVINGIRYIPTKLDMENIAKYTPLLWYRNQGTGTEEIGDINKQKNLRSALASKATTALEHHNMSSLAKLTGLAERGINWQMDVLQKIDTKAVGSLWKASEIYVQDKLKMSPKNGEDAYYRTVAKVFNNCVDDTQANYVTMQRPDILRNPNKAYKMLFLFKTQPLQNFNIMYDAFGNLRAKGEAYKNAKGLNSKIKDAAEQEYILAKREFARAVSSQVAAAVGVFCMKFAADVFKHRMDKYRNEEDDITRWQIVEELVNEVLSNLAGSVLGGNELYSFITSFITGDTYYGISVAVIDSINDFTESLINFHEKPSAKNLKQIFFDLSVLVGDSGENSYKFFDGLGLYLEDIKNGEPLSFNAGHETKLSVQYTTMMNALVEGDNKRYEERYAETLETMLLTKTEDEAKSAIVSGIKGKLKKSYLETEISYDDVIAILDKIGDKEPYFTIKEWDNAENDEYSKYSELKAAVVSGKGIDEEMAELTNHGVKEETAKEKLLTAIKEAYKNGDITKDKAMEYLKIYKKDFTDDDAYWELRKWDKQDSYIGDEKYGKYDDLVDAVESDDFDSVVKEYVEHGTSVTTIKTTISNKYRPLYQEAYLSGNHKTVNALKEILNKLRVNGKRLYNQEDYLNWNKQAKEQKKND